MGLLNTFINRYAARRRASSTSQTTTHHVNGKQVFRNIPEACLPVFPVISFKSLFGIFSKKPATVLDHGYPDIPVTAARYAITHALRLLDIKPGDEILLPAYHCTVMVAPIVKMGATPVFFKIAKNLDSDINDIAQKITPQTKAIIAVNYCGFVQNIADVRALCDMHNVALIEDCAHSFFGQKDGVTVGGYGDYVLVSTRKFFPVPEGGSLMIRPPFTHTTRQKKRTLTASLRANLSLIEKSLKHGRLWLLAPLIELVNFLIQGTKRLLGKVPSPVENTSVPSSLVPDMKNIQEGENAYIHEIADKQAVYIHQLIPKLLNSVQVTKRRRQNFLWLYNNFQEIKGCRVLVYELPDGIVPFMFPVYIENLQKYFPAFEDAALPLQRFAQFLWDDTAEEACPVTADYSKNVILFPCHQELSQADLEWLAQTVRTILERAE
ncbi:hypothetical protein CRD36_05120 [Paremcibacter congregatus]|uniref:DegT/DnrJ/EryC1/StrS aminotransferase n=1 Tax=Paremcibacter congregatus TaxID=2043170 RepID=A0A2G4YUR0_9PROT|nr:hypothetical protein CRD36_05120 [Paremcibacter congregatus]QDE27021.1 hypothetical protein FIV45_06895 [Paremcibacter congregatus]